MTASQILAEQLQLIRGALETVNLIKPHDALHVIEFTMAARYLTEPKFNEL